MILSLYTTFDLADKVKRTIIVEMIVNNSIEKANRGNDLSSIKFVNKDSGEEENSNLLVEFLSKQRILEGFSVNSIQCVNVDMDDDDSVKAELALLDTVPNKYAVNVHALSSFFSTLLRKKASTSQQEMQHITSILSSINKFGVVLDTGINSGCHVLFGPAGSGKSKMIESIVSKLEESNRKGSNLIVGEPTGYSESTAQGLRKLILTLLFGFGETLIIDSLRGIVYSGLGVTLSGGFSASLIELLAECSSLSDWGGNSVVVVVNPLTANEDKTSTLYEAIKGSSTSVILLSYDDYTTATITSRNLPDRAEKSWPRDAVSNFLIGTSTTNNANAQATIGKSSSTNFIMSDPNGLDTVLKQHVNLTDGSDDINSNVDGSLPLTNLYAPLF